MKELRYSMSQYQWKRRKPVGKRHVQYKYKDKDGTMIYESLESALNEVQHSK